MKTHSKALESILYFLMCGIFISCAYQGDENASYIRKLQIPENEVPVMASEVFTSMEMIRLGVSGDKVINEIVKLELFDDKILILENQGNGLYLFNRDGTFVRFFDRHGRGPGEYLTLNDFLINTQTRTLEILDRQSKTINVYNLDDFTFLQEIILPPLSVFSFIRIEDVYYFQTNRTRNTIAGTETNSEVIAWNTRTHEVRALSERLKSDEENHFLELSNIFLISGQNRVFISQLWDYYIYELRNDSLVPVLEIDPGQRKIPSHILQGTTQQKIEFLFSMEDDFSIGTFSVLRYEEDGIILAYRVMSEENTLYFFSLNGGTRGISAQSVVNDLDKVSYPIHKILKVEQKFAVAVIYPAEEPCEKALDYLQLHQNDNPVLLLLYF